jgi:hypothetical protein
VNAFWSLTMYDGKTQLLIENPINRYLINSAMMPAMKMNADASPPGYNWIVQDELQNTYDACKEGACNFKP